MIKSEANSVADPLDLEEHSKTAVITAPKTIEVQEMNLPEPNANQVLIKMTGCGMCASTIPVWEGRDWFTYPLPPGNPGHEGWGEIVATGEEVRNFRPGQLVAVLNDTALADYSLATENQLVALPEMLRNIPFPGEPFGCVANIRNRMQVSKGDTVAVIGLGFIGLCLTAILAREGIHVIALSRREFSRNKASELGAKTTVEMDDHYRIIDHVKKITAGKGCNFVVECTGKSWPLDLAAELVAERGTLVIAGYHQEARQVNMQLWNWKGLDVINAHERDVEVYKDGVRTAVKWIQEGMLDPRDFLTHHFTLDQLPEAFEMLRKTPEGTIKTWIKFGE